MSFGAAFIFDPQTTRAVREVWQAQADAGLPSFMLGVDYPPHMTLLMGEGVDLPGLRPGVAMLASRIRPVPVMFESLGVFPAEYGVVFLAPCIHQGLLDLHAAFWTAFEPFVSGPASQYRPGVWVPHVTLGFQLKSGELGRVTEFLAGWEFPRSGLVTGIEFGDYVPGGSSTLETMWFGEESR